MQTKLLINGKVTAGGGKAAVRLHVDQHALHVGERDAARGPEALRLRQGPVDVRARGLQRRAARHGETLAGSHSFDGRRP
jgi:hypothetical protein